jgi:integrase
MASGWRCPGCERVWAPHVNQCSACEPGAVGAANTFQPTLETLWDEHYAPWGRKHVGSWKAVRAGHRKHLLGFFGKLAWDKCTHAKFDEYIEWRRTQRTIRGGPPRPATLNSELASLKACLSWCLTGAPKGQRPITGPNPMDGYEELQVTSERRFPLSEADFMRLLEHSRPLLRLMLIFAFETGMRRDEFRRLTWDELDLNLAIVRLPAERTKTRRARDVPLSDTALEVLKLVPRLSRSVVVFENPKGNGQPVPKATLHRWFVHARTASGVKGPKDVNVWMHTIRKTFATRQAMSGMPIYQLMEVLGHSSADVHFEYTRMSPEYQGAIRDHLNRRRGPQAATAEQAPAAVSPLLKFVTGS